MYKIKEFHLSNKIQGCYKLQTVKNKFLILTNCRWPSKELKPPT